MVLDCHDATSFCDKVEMCSFFSLFDHYVIWLIYKGTDACEKILDDVVVLAEKFVLFEGSFENMVRHVGTNVQRKHRHEFFEFILIIKGVLCVHHIFEYFILNVLW
jgi:hypothetical protein